jgi:DMSO/TMAO reductase YedYZ heme-binding membrane subunit/uncharacterized protein with FMN-binding domain
MLFLIALILAFGFAFCCRKPLKEHSKIFYVSAIVISVLISTLNFRGLPNFLNNYVIALFSRGALATALWCVVMWAGAFPNGSKPIKAIMPIRGELSIFTAILTLGHNIGFGKTYFVRLFTDVEKMSTNQVVASILTIIMLLIMLPLTVMSFPTVRKKFDPKLWKKIQRLAYVFYALIYTHVMVLCVPQAKLGREGYLFSIAMYSLAFIGYAIFRIKKYLTVKKRIKESVTFNIVCGVLTVVLTGVIIACVRPSTTETEDTTPATNQPIETPIVTTTITTIGDSVGITTTTPNTVTTTNDISTTSGITTTTDTGVTTTGTGETSQTTTTSATTSATQQTTNTITTVTNAQNSESVVSNDSNSNNNSNNNVNSNDTNNNNVVITENQQQNQQQNQVVVDNNPSVGNNDSYVNTTEAEVEPIVTEPNYIYYDGTYTATAYGYDGDVQITITIVNDVITSIDGYSDESDPWYFEQASASVYQEILDSQNPAVDAVSGATYSSNAIMTAVQSALNSARK